MTSDSRVEAVARGLCKKGRNDPDKVVNNLFGPDPSKKVPLWTQYRGEAQAAIEASAAWLEQHLSFQSWIHPDQTARLFDLLRRDQ